MSDANPEKALEALVEPSPLTLGQIALLERIDSPLLRGDVSSIHECARGLWLLSLPPQEAATRWRESEQEAIAWLDAVGVQGYRNAVTRVLDGITAFFDMLPRPDGEDVKKKD